MSDFGFWTVEGECEYDRLACECHTIAGMFSALFNEEMDPDHLSAVEASSQSDDDAPITRPSKRAKPVKFKFTDAKGQFLVQLPHFGISCHFKSRKQAKEFMFKTFQNVDPKLKPRSSVGRLEELALAQHKDWTYYEPIVVLEVEPEECNQLCVAWEDGIDCERWASLPYGYAPKESPFDPAYKKLQPFFGDKWRLQLTNPCNKLAKIMDTLHLYYITTQGEVRMIGKMAEEKKCLDMQASTCALVTDEEFAALKMGFGPAKVQWRCKVCHISFQDTWPTVQDYMLAVKTHYLTHGDFGYAPFIDHHHEIRGDYMDNRKEDMYTVFQKLKDVEIGSTSSYGWHKDEVLHSVMYSVTYKPTKEDLEAMRQQYGNDI